MVAANEQNVTTDNSALRVLVVDDHHFLRTAVQRMLVSLGVKEVLQANDGQRALDILQDETTDPIDVVLCDLDMPGMDGMEFIRHLATGQETPLSIIIISGLDTALINSVEKMTTAYGLRLLGAIEKPLSLAKLEHLLELHHQSKIPSTPEVSVVCTKEEVLLGLSMKQFEPFFQPKVDFRTGHVVGAEALARWRHPQHGLLEPRDFLSLVEEVGKMDVFTFLILEEAVAACHLLGELGHAVSIAVNMSLISLTNSTFADRITQAVSSAGVDPKRMIFEITESATMTEEAHALENLARLRMRGFGLSIDDYGTGYSSMQQLTRIAFSELKIDSSFVKNVSKNRSLRIIVESSIDMARKLQVKSIAEGVESEEDWEALKSMGCDAAQGYFIAKPMDLTALLEFCATH
jgi:EAL domain-containing protein (putative c-di-GMP-specific phosphodiesterase class I)